MAKWTSRTFWIAGATCLFWLVGAPTASLSQGPSPPVGPVAEQSNSHLQMASTTLPTGVQQLVILDSNAKTLAVYHVENGNLQLRSIRNLAYDLRMEEFNGLPPLPSELRRAQQ